MIMYCGILEIKNNSLEISYMQRITRRLQQTPNKSDNFAYSSKQIPSDLKDTVDKISIRGSNLDRPLCNLHFIEVNDFDKDLYDEISPCEYLEVLLQTKKYIFKGGKQYNRMLPTLHLSNIDYFDTKIASSSGVILPRCLKYIDSSIWHYYVPAHIDEKSAKRKMENVDYLGRLQKAINAILENTNIGLYNLSVTQEQADFYARIIPQSYLADIGAHKKRISPFLFHSEEEMKYLLSKEKFSSYMPEIKEMVIKEEASNVKYEKAEWRFLLVDDYADKMLKTYPLGQTTFCKKERISNILKTLFINNNCIKIVSVSSIDDAVKHLRNQKFDLILLDYLLGYKPGGQREYGYDLLIRINDDINLRANKGPFGKFWIFPITSFDEAFAQKMREQGLYYNSDNWFLAQGACPLDTPESFKYYLCKLMDSQIRGLAIEIKECKRKEVHTLTQFLMAIFDEKEKARKRALKNFNALYLLKANYGKLKHDVRLKNKEATKENQSEASSRLVKSIFKDINNYDAEFWEHIVFMMYLTAYPPANQWFRLSAEYLFIEKKLDEKVREKIKDYITYMKNM